MAGKERGAGSMKPEDDGGTASVRACAVVGVSIDVVASTVFDVVVDSGAVEGVERTSAIVKGVTANESSG